MIAEFGKIGSNLNQIARYFNSGEIHSQEMKKAIHQEYAQKNFPGHQALVCTHMDGNNERGNIHVHIVINSLRKFDVAREPFMQRSCDSRAGYKHHLTKEYLIHLKQSVMDLCRREHLHQVDLLTPAEKKITEREYHARRRGQRNMDERNKKMISEGIAPRRTKFQTQKDFLRTAIADAAASARTLEEFQKLLMEKYHVILKISRGRFSYLHPERSKPITGRSLGTHYEESYLLPLFEKNAEQQISGVVPAFIFIKSGLRLVVDLQQCVKAQQSQAYAQKVKLSNLQQMAKTVAYVQEHGYDTLENLQDAFSQAQSQTAELRKALRFTEQKLKEVNRQIHYTGQYLANQSVYNQFLKSKNKKLFRQEHSSEITLYETARKILQEHSGSKKLPSIKTLKAEKGKLTALKNGQHEAYQNLYNYEKELRTVSTNVDTILGKERSWQSTKETILS